MFGHQKHVPYFSLNFCFSLPEYFVYLLCLPVFPVSVIGSIINTTAIKTVVGKFELRMSRPLPHVNRLCRPAIGSCAYAQASQDLLSSHISEERFVYLVQNESFFFNSRKIFPTKEMHTIALIILHVKTGYKDQSVSISF